MPSKRTAKSTPAKKATRGKKPIGLTSALGPKVTTIVVICVMAGGIAIAARQQQAKVKNPTPADAQVEMTPDMPTVMPQGSGKPASATNSPAAVVRTASVPKAPSVTISGCLEGSDGVFRLKDTDGAGAPKSRSWKSGFLKKGSASVAVVDASNGVDLSLHAGQRVAITGTLVDREMRADSLRRLSASCKAS